MDSENNQTIPVEDIFVDEFVVEAPAGPDEDEHLKAIIEAAIYITDEPLTPAQIAAALSQPAERVNRLLDELAAEYNGRARGLSIREIAGGYKMATKPEHHEAIRTFVKNLKPPLKLSLPALETLAVIAYKQPVTAPEIMEIRGVQGVGVLKTLLDRKLIAAAGRKHVVGKPILYKTTKEFMVQFGLKDLTELPSLKEFEELGRLALGDTEEPVAAAAAQPDPSRDPEPIKEPEPEPPPVRDPNPTDEPVPPTDPEREPVRAGDSVADESAEEPAAATTQPDPEHQPFQGGHTIVDESEKDLARADTQPDLQNQAFHAGHAVADESVDEPAEAATQPATEHHPAKSEQTAANDPGKEPAA